MNWKALLDPVARYTLVWALVTVGAAYLVFRSGAALLLLAGAGVMLVVLGAGEAGAAPAAGVEAAEDAGLGMMTEDVGLWPGSDSTYSLRAKFLFYGLGLLVWNLVGLAILLR